MNDPLTGRTSGAREMTVALLKYANRAEVARALTAGGYSVTRKTVNRWAAGDEMPDIAARMILELFLHDLSAQQETAPPEWVERLLTGVMALETNGEISDAELAQAQAKAAAYLVVARRRRLRPADGGADDAASS